MQKLNKKLLWDKVFLRALAARDTDDTTRDDRIDDERDDWRSFPVFAVDGAIRVTTAWIPIPEGFRHPLGALLRTHDAYFKSCLFYYIMANCEERWAEESGHLIDEGDYVLGDARFCIRDNQRSLAACTRHKGKPRNSTEEHLARTKRARKHWEKARASLA